MNGSTLSPESKAVILEMKGNYFSRLPTMVEPGSADYPVIWVYLRVKPLTGLICFLFYDCGTLKPVSGIRPGLENPPSGCLKFTAEDLE
jgi:hypothetical protein